MKKQLTAYFSQSGTTRAAAEHIAALTGSDLYEIRSAEPGYSEITESSWPALFERSTKFRPKLIEDVPDFSQYDKILIGYPIWWFTAPQVIFSFLDRKETDGIEIYPFYTATYSDGRKSEHQIAKMLLDNVVHPALNANHATDDQINAWLNESRRIDGNETAPSK